MKRSEALQPLSHDHYEGLQLVARLRKALRAGEDLAGWAETVAAFWRDHLVRHFAEEEATVLPVLEAGAPPLAEQMAREHWEIGRRVRELEPTPDALATFAGALAAHIRFEEREAFPAAERHADAETLAAIHRQLRTDPSPPDA